MPDRRMGLVELTPEALRMALCLPEGVKVLRVREDPKVRCGEPRIQLILEGDGLPLVVEGGEVPQVAIWHTKTFTEHGDVIKFDRFNCWDG